MKAKWILVVLVGMTSGLSMAGGRSCMERFKTAARMFVEVSGYGFVVPESTAELEAVSGRLACSRARGDNACLSDLSVVVFGVGEQTPVSVHVLVSGQQIGTTDDCVVNSIEWVSQQAEAAPMGSESLFPAP